MKSILNVQVSWYDSFNSKTSQPETVNLLDYLQDTRYKELVEKIRMCSDQQVRDQMKKQLPGITPSGCFSYRNEGGLIQHSGFISFDIDLKHNTHIANYSDLKRELSKIKNVAYCGRSASGTGYWVLIPIAYPEKHKEHFAAAVKFFAKKEIKIDTAPSNVASFRFYSYDPDAYFNHQALVYTQYEQPTNPVNPAVYYNSAGESDQAKVEACLNQLNQGRIDITSTYADWFAIGCNFAGTFGESGREYFHQVSQFYPKYDQVETDKQFTCCLKALKGPASLGVFFNRCRAIGIFYKNSIPGKSGSHPASLSPGNKEKREPSPEPILMAQPEENLENRDAFPYLDSTNSLMSPAYETVGQPTIVSKEIKLIPHSNKEYYHYSFQELKEELGEEEAVKKLTYYQKLSEQYQSCKSFVIHSCTLLTTFKQEQQYPLAS